MIVLAIKSLRWRLGKKYVNENVRKLTVDIHPPVKVFEQSMVSELPELVQRYFLYSIKIGTPLYHCAKLSMQGNFSFDIDKAYLQLSARQIICAPHGMVWMASIGRGLSAISGSDGVVADKSWTQFALIDLLTVVKIKDNEDHYQSAVGRMLAEALFWTPAALLGPLPVVWKTMDKNTIQATIRHGHFDTSIDIKLKPNGCPIEVCFQRWSDANPQKIYRYQPFGGYLSNFKEFEGITVPTHVEAGNFFGTDDFFPFYIVDVCDLQWMDDVANRSKGESVCSSEPIRRKG